MAVAFPLNFHDSEHCALLAQKNRTDVMYKIRLTIKFNMLIAIPCAFGMAALASPVLRLISKTAGPHLNLLMLGAPVIFSPLHCHQCGSFGIDLMRKSVTHSAISSGACSTGICDVKVLKLGRVWPGYRQCNFARLVVCVLNWHAIGKALRYRQEVKTTFLLPCACAAVARQCVPGLLAGQ